MNKICTFGEIMYRLTPPNNELFRNATDLQVGFAGSEANTAVALSNLGVDAKYLTVLANNELGITTRNSLRAQGVDTNSVVFNEHRMGTIFIEKGYSQRPSKVIYDRKDSAFAMQQKEDFDFTKELENTEFFHTSGITSALSECALFNQKQAIKYAKANGIKNSFDLNYRSKLWSKEKAEATLKTFVNDIDIIIGNEDDYNDYFSFLKDRKTFSNNEEFYIHIGNILEQKYGEKICAFSNRESISANKNMWSGTLYYEGHTYTSKKYTIDIIDRVGAGDSFSAGIIYGILNNYKPQEIIDFAVALSCLKHTINNDYCTVSLDDVLHLIGGDESGRIKR